MSSVRRLALPVLSRRACSGEGEGEVIPGRQRSSQPRKRRRGSGIGRFQSKLAPRYTLEVQTPGWNKQDLVVYEEGIWCCVKTRDAGRLARVEWIFPDRLLAEDKRATYRYDKR
jgi:hypothetical protein